MNVGIQWSASKLFLAGAVALVLVSLVIFSQLLGRGTEKPAVEAPKAEPLVIVTRPVLIGQLITSNDIQLVDWPKAYYPDAAAVFTSTDAVIGHVARKDLLPGEPLFKQKVAGADVEAGLPVLIPDGMRALTVQVTDIKGLAGLLKPGDHVDVLATVQQELDEQTINLSKTILQNTTVLAVEQDTDDQRLAAMQALDVAETDKKATATPQDAENDLKDQREKKVKARLEAQRDQSTDIPKNVTLAMWPDEAEKVMLAEEMGSLRLSLRPEFDHTPAKVKGVTAKELFGTTAARGVTHKPVASKPVEPVRSTAAAAAPSPSAGSGYAVEVYEGTSRSSVNF
jgi:pilus assembly protein CpaB